MEHVDVTRVVDAAVADAFARYADIPSWTRWAGMGTVTQEPPGSPVRAGTLRVVRQGRWRVVEEITEVDPPHRLAYRLVSGFPLRDHSGHVTFEPHPRGTTVHWHCSFRSRVPGLGPLFRAWVSRVFRRVLAGLAEDLRSGAPR